MLRVDRPLLCTVAVVDGAELAARRSRAVDLAERGADVVLLHHGSVQPLLDTQRRIEALGRTCFTYATETTDLAALLAEIASALGDLSYVIARDGRESTLASELELTAARFARLLASRVRALD